MSRREPNPFAFLDAESDAPVCPLCESVAVRVRGEPCETCAEAEERALYRADVALNAARELEV